MKRKWEQSNTQIRHHIGGRQLVQRHLLIRYYSAVYESPNYFTSNTLVSKHPTTIYFVVRMRTGISETNVNVITSATPTHVLIIIMQDIIQQVHITITQTSAQLENIYSRSVESLHCAKVSLRFANTSSYTCRFPYFYPHKVSIILQVFYWTHSLFFVFWLLLILHGPIFWMFFIVPGAAYLAERIYRTRLFKLAKYGTIHITETNLLPSKVSRSQRPRDFANGTYPMFACVIHKVAFFY